MTAQPGDGLLLRGAADDPCDSVMLHRSLLRAAAAGGADTRRLARDAGLSKWDLARGDVMLPARYYLRLWELVEWALEDPPVPLIIASRHRVGELGLYDYLFTTAATLRDGITVAADYLHLVTTNSRAEILAGGGRDAAYIYRLAEPRGRGGELCTLFSAAQLCVRARAGTGRFVAPAKVALATAPPRSLRAFAEVFGTHRVDFGAPVSSVTFSARDLDVPMTGADWQLAGILGRYAASFPPPRSATFATAFRVVLAKMIEHGAPSLADVATQLAVSSRTLQRRLAEDGTTWRAELDAARRSIASCSNARTASMASLTRKLGYSDPRSARRALRRWSEATAQLQLPVTPRP